MCRRLVFLVLLCSLTASGVTLDIWLTHTIEEMRILEELTEGFTAKTGISVNYIAIPSADSETRFLMAAAAGDPYDVGGVGSLFAPELGLRGAVLDLRQFPDYHEVAGNFYPHYFRSLEYEQVTFGLPYRSYLYLGFQRTDIFEQLGLEKLTTWTQLTQILPRLQAQGMNFALPFGLGDSVYADVNMFLWQFGADDYTPDLKYSGYDTPEAIAGFNAFSQLYTDYRIVKEAQHFQGFISGDLPILMYSASLYTSFERSAPQIAGKWEMTPALGNILNGELNNATFIGGMALTISTQSKHPKQAWEYLKWITSTPVQAELSRRIMGRIPGSFIIPGNSQAIPQLPLPQQATQTLAIQAESSMASIYGLVAPRHRRRYLQFAAQEAVLLGVDPEVALAKAAKEHNEEIRRKTQEYERFIKRLLQR